MIMECRLLSQFQATAQKIPVVQEVTEADVLWLQQIGLSYLVSELQLLDVDTLGYNVIQ